MKNINEVIKGKEQQLQQIQREIEVLRAAARLLADDGDDAPARPATSTNVAVAPTAPQMVMRPAQPAAPASVSKETTSYVSPSAWDVTKPQFP